MWKCFAPVIGNCRNGCIRYLKPTARYTCALSEPWPVTLFCTTGCVEEARQNVYLAHVLSAIFEQFVNEAVAKPSLYLG